MAAFELQEQSAVVASETAQHTKPKIFTVRPSTEQLC